MKIITDRHEREALAALCDGSAVLTEWAIGQDESGRVVAHYKAISDHPWKDREYSWHFARALSTADLQGLDAEARRLRAEAEAAKSKADTEASERAAWITSLPNTIDLGGWTVLVDKQAGVITDDIGNYLIGLPKRPVADIAEWVAQNMVDPE